MFFVGASAHPGTGVPVVVCGSKLTADHVNAYLTGRPIFDSAKYEGMAMLFSLLLLVLFVGLQYAGPAGLKMGSLGLHGGNNQTASWNYAMATVTKYSEEL